MRNLLFDLKMDLGVRPNNIDVGSGLGGNASEFYFLLSKDVYLNLIEGNEISFEENKDNKLIIHCNKNEKLLNLRKKLTSFYNTHSDKMDIDFERLSHMMLNISQIENNLSKDINLLCDCFKIMETLSFSLKRKLKLNELLVHFFKNEIELIEIAFAKSANTERIPYPTSNSNNVAYWKKYKKFHSLMKLDPHTFNNLKDLEKRHIDILELTYSQNDLELIETINNFSDYIKIVPFRLYIGIDILISLRLDEKMLLNNLKREKSD